MVKDSITLSKKYGVNPSMQICFFCGKSIGIVLNGKIGKGDKDIEAPKEVVVDYEPCEKCKKIFSQGLLVMGATDHVEDSRPEIQKGLYPTGSYFVIKDEAIDNFLNNLNVDENFKNHIREKKVLLMDDKVVRHILNQNEQEG